MDDQEKLSALGPEGKRFFAFAAERMHGQDKAILRLAKAIDTDAAGMSDPTRPIYSVLVVGGSGSGKSMLAELLAEFWFGARDALTVLYPEQWDVDRSRLVQYDYRRSVHSGSRAGKFMRKYNDLSAHAQELAQAVSDPNLGEAERKEKELQKETIERQIAMVAPHVGPAFNALRSILVLDHFEGNEDIPGFFFPMLSQGVLRGDIVTLKRAVIFILCDNEVRVRGAAKTIGIQAKESVPQARKKDGVSYLKGIDTVKEHLSSTILSRLDRIEILRPYGRETLRRILDDQIRNFQTELAQTFPVILEVSDEVCNFIVEDASDHEEWGIWLLHRKMNKYLREPLAALKASEKLSRASRVVASSVTGSSEGKRVKFLVQPPRTAS